MTDFTRDALEQAMELTPLGVEVGFHDGDGCELLIGKHARIACHDGCKRYTLSLDGMPGYSYPFPTLEAAVRSASTVECVFASLRKGVWGDDQRDGEYCHISCPTEGCTSKIYGTKVEAV